MKIQSWLLVKNTYFNFMGQAVPAIVAVAVMPYIISGMGPERFGVLSLAWIVLGYFNLFDFGIGRAVTKFAAQRIAAKQDAGIRDIVWASFTAQSALGVFAGVTLALSAHFLANNVFKVHESLQSQLSTVFYVLAAALPVVICTKGPRSILEAAQRFDIINLVQIPFSCMIFIVPFAGVFLAMSLPAIIILLALLMLINAVIYFFFVFKIFPSAVRPASLNISTLKQLLSFGGWVTLGNITVPFLVYFDRFLIVSLVSMAALSYYVVSFEVVSKLAVFPLILGTTTYPAFSALSRINNADIERIYVRSLKYIVLLMGPCVVFLVLFSRDILAMWLGNDFATNGAVVMGLLACGMLFNALAQMSANLLDGIGRPDLRAKTLVSYLFMYLILAWFLVKRNGIIGAAYAWLARGMLEFFLFSAVSWKTNKFRISVFMENGLIISALVFLTFAALVSLVRFFSPGIFMPISVTVCFIVFVFFGWLYLMDDKEKAVFRLLFSVGGR